MSKNLSKFSQGLIVGVVLFLAFGLIVGSFAYRSYIWTKGEAISTAQTFAATEKPLPEHPIKGNKDSRIYHWFGCPNYDDISPRNAALFATIEDAEAKGFRPARNCSTAPGVPGRPRRKTRAEIQAERREQNLINQDSPVK